MNAEQPEKIMPQDEFLVSLATPMRVKAEIASSGSAAADRKNNRKIAGEDPAKRGQILDGARIVFTRMGFDGASMSDITREAGVSKGTIYVYFKNKEDLFLALIARQREALFGNLRQLLDEGLPVPETLELYGKMLTKTLLSSEAVRAQRAIIGTVGRMPEMGIEFFNKGPRISHGLLGNWLRAHVERGTLQIPDVELAVDQFIELCLAGQLRPRLFGAFTEDPCPDTIQKSVGLAVYVFCKAYGAPGASLQE